MVKKLSFEAVPFRIKDLVLIKVPPEIASEIEGRKSTVTVAFDYNRNNGLNPEDIKKMNILEDLKKWLLKLASEESDTSVTPRAVALNFKINENDAVKYLSILEADDIIKSDDSKGYLIYRVKNK